MRDSLPDGLLDACSTAGARDARRVAHGILKAVTVEPVMSVADAVESLRRAQPDLFKPKWREKHLPVDGIVRVVSDDGRRGYRHADDPDDIYTYGPRGEYGANEARSIARAERSQSRKFRGGS
jgi:hypothetical protein